MVEKNNVFFIIHFMHEYPNNTSAMICRVTIKVELARSLRSEVWKNKSG